MSCILQIVAGDYCCTHIQALLEERLLLMITNRIYERTKKNRKKGKPIMSGFLFKPTRIPFHSNAIKMQSVSDIKVNLCDSSSLNWWILHATFAHAVTIKKIRKWFSRWIRWRFEIVPIDFDARTNHTHHMNLFLTQMIRLMNTYFTGGNFILALTDSSDFDSREMNMKKHTQKKLKEKKNKSEKKESVDISQADFNQNMESKEPDDYQSTTCGSSMNVRCISKCDQSHNHWPSHLKCIATSHTLCVRTPKTQIHTQREK